MHPSRRERSSSLGTIVPPSLRRWYPASTAVGAGIGLQVLAVKTGMMAAAYAGGPLYAGGATHPFAVSLGLLALTALATGLLALT